MATKPRLSITLTPSLAVKLDRLCELTGESKSGTVAEILEQAEPVFDRMIQVLEAAETAREAFSASLVSGLEDSQSAIEQQLGLILDHFDKGAAPILEMAEKVSRRARGRAHSEGSQQARGTAPGASPTPLSNRGVRSDLEEGKRKRKSKACGVSVLESGNAEKSRKKGRPDAGAI